MTPKEKAIELVDKYWQLNYDWDGTTKEGWAIDGALIALNEMEEVYASAVSAILNSKKKAELFNSRFLQEVKQEIEKLNN